MQGRLSKFVWLEKIRNAIDYYPLTVTGSLLLAAAFYLLYTAANGGNPFALLFSVISLVVILMLALDGRLQALRSGKLHILWDSAAPLYARMSGIEQRLFTGELSVHYFYRLHFSLRGYLDAGRSSRLYLYAEAASNTGGEIHLPLYFPVCGALHVRGQLFIRDVFGLTKTRLSGPQIRTLSVRPPFFSERSPMKLHSIFSSDTARKKQSSEDEKYYMREYIPGDRLKDINWKASIRVSELITKISPISQEESQLLNVAFRHFTQPGKDTVVSIMHLNYAKSWLLSFINAVKKEHPDYRFRIQTGAGVFFIETEQDMEKFAQTVSVLPFMSEPASFHETDVNIHEIFVFSTSYDSGLGAFMGLWPSARFNVFRTTRGGSGKTRKVRFFGEGMGVLPGPWIFRPDKPKKTPPAAVRGSLIEEKLSVRLV